MAKSPNDLRLKADQLITEAKEKARLLRDRADELETAEELAEFKRLKVSGKLAEYIKAEAAKTEAPAAKGQSEVEEGSQAV